jgi:HEAT repeat protein
MGWRDFMKPNIEKMNKRGNVDGLIKASTHADWNIRAAAICSLGSFKDQRAVSALTALLKDRYPLAREYAVTALQAIGGNTAIDPLIEALDDSLESIRISSAKALVKIGEPAVESLISALVKPDGWVRIEAARALAAIGDRRAGGPLKVAFENGTTTMVGHAMLAEALVEWAAAPTRNLPPNLRF